MHSSQAPPSTIILPAQLATKMQKSHLSTNKCAAAYRATYIEGEATEFEPAVKGSKLLALIC